MKRVLASLSILIMILFCQFAQAQTTGSISGTVTDSNGAVVPNANVSVKGQSGQEFTATTSENGTYRIPAVGAGFYTVTVTVNGFKKSVFSNVKVDVGLPTGVDAVLEVGAVEQVVEVTTGGEVLQTQTATVGTNIQGRQITETPIASRDALDLVSLMPGTATVGRPRSASINGLPKGSISITIDGVDVQDNVLRSSDGYFTYVRPRVDAIEEVTVSTANPGAESGGDGAVSIKFQTKRGTNDYSGGIFMQHRNTALNAAYWYNNRDLKPNPGYTKAPRSIVILNQYGGRFGGPLPFPHFGEGGPYIHSGKDKSFFFVNYEEFRLPESQTRSRTVLTPDAIAGNFKYISGGVTNTVNLFALAAANGQISTADSTVAAVLNKINSSVATTGTLRAITNSSGVVTDPNRLTYTFAPSGMQVRKFFAGRFDFNLTKNHSLEFIHNRQKFVPSRADFLNSVEERFPGFPSYGQGSDRNSYSTALRSVLTQSIVNEFRFATMQGDSVFFPTASAADFAYSGGYLLDIGAASVTTPYPLNSRSARGTPTYDYTDSVTWTFGNHSVNFGGQYKEIRPHSTAYNRLVPTVSFGVDATDPLDANAMFLAVPLANRAEAKALYATLIGRITGYANTAYLGEDNRYMISGPITQKSKQRTYGLFAQDAWRVNPSLSINYGIRWQPQGGYVILTPTYARLNSFAEVYGPSGLGNLFKPGTLTGTPSTVVGMQVGEEVYKEDRNNFAPSVGVVWSPGFESGFLKTLFGSNRKSVIRGGFSRSFVREGTALIGSLLGANPGGSMSASRNLGIAGSFTVGTNLRDAGNPNLTPFTFPASPVYPFALTTANSANAFDPNLKTGSVDSYSFGYQREIDKNSVIEIRYTGNRGTNLFRQHNINELNTIENGFASEYALAQANLYANQAAGRGNTFAYFGAGTGTNPLPKTLAYIYTPTAAAPYDPNNAARYNSSLFINNTLINQLSRLNPQVIGFAAAIENNAVRRANAITNGLPSNFFYANSTTLSSGAYILDNSARSWYDSGSIEFRRRMSDGLRIQTSYVWSKAQSDSFQSNSDNFANFVHRPFGRDLAKNVAVFDIRHAFKLDATYDLPFGKGRAFFSNSNWLVNGILGGWTILPTVKWQSGSPFSFGNVQLVGMTKNDLQKAIGVYKGPSVVTFLPDDIILNTQKAFNIDVTNTGNGGYGTTFGTGGPTGRYLAPAGTGNCQSTYSGQCGFNNLIVYGPSFFKIDTTVTKRFSLGEKRNIEFRATILDVLNHPNFRVGGWAADVITVGLGGSTFAQMGSGSAYQDLSTTNDPGGRIIDLMFRFNF